MSIRKTKRGQKRETIVENNLRKKIYNRFSCKGIQGSLNKFPDFFLMGTLLIVHT